MTSLFEIVKNRGIRDEVEGKEERTMRGVNVGVIRGI